MGLRAWCSFCRASSHFFSLPTRELLFAFTIAGILGLWMLIAAIYRANLRTVGWGAMVVGVPLLVFSSRVLARMQVNQQGFAAEWLACGRYLLSAYGALILLYGITVVTLSKSSARRRRAPE